MANRRRRFSLSEKAEILRRYHASGLSIQAFARGEEVSANAVGSWLRKETNGESSGASSGLVPVQVKRAERPDHGVIEIVLRDGCRIRVRQGFDEKLLEQVVVTLHRCLH